MEVGGKEEGRGTFFLRRRSELKTIMPRPQASLALKQTGSCT